MCQRLRLDQERRSGLLRVSPIRSDCFAYLSNCFTDATNPQQIRIRREYFRAIKWNPLTCAYRPCVLCMTE
ncbi:hypothetical protein PAMC26577_13550 [Caballeronia sordidicola]|uniref:Uncharacterized protein n=1 Tax=Caballeronia sordidicola TaxID=196367 RepID=A0A242MW03_CABSO|nr:hypothetical protein PAMC26577_13550 [Caballeronia sordidicola]